MKKLIGFVMLLVCLFFLCSCQWLFPEKTLTEITAEHLSLSLENTTVLEEWDIHGGFHGDGETFVKLSCPDGFEESLKASWNLLPLEGEAYQYFYEWGGVLEHPERGEKLIPEVKNGYWYFKNTGPMNWEFAIYDCDKNILYFYIFDA